MQRTTVTVVDADDVTTTVAATNDGARILLDAAALEAATGWVHKPVGLCRGDLCIPTSVRPDLTVVDPAGGDDELVDLAVFAELTQQPAVIDVDECVAAFGTPAAVRAEQRTSLAAPDFTVEDLHGRAVGLSDFRGKKKMLVAFASWCGCAYDLPAWQQMQDELADRDFAIIGVAVDEKVEDVTPFTEDIAFPVLLDRDHVITERYDIRNVPTVVWIDEDDQIVRPNDVAFGTDMFKDFHHIDSDPHHDALRQWVTTGAAPMAPGEVVEKVLVPSDDEQLARVHWRVAMALYRDGRHDAANRHFDRAGELAPHDFTIRRGSMPLRGIDPFLSEEFIELFEGYNAAGRPGYGFGHDE
jgi:peroxiredoxin